MFVARGVGGPVAVFEKMPTRKTLAYGAVGGATHARMPHMLALPRHCLKRLERVFSIFQLAWLCNLKMRHSDPSVMQGCKRSSIAVQVWVFGIGAKIEHKLISLKLFGASWTSRQNPGMSRPKVCFPWISRDTPNLLAPTPSRGRPPPHLKISGQKRLGLGSFSSLKEVIDCNEGVGVGKISKDKGGAC